MEDHMRTSLCDQLGIEFPIFAFTHCRDVAAAVSRAGGLGVLGIGTHTPDQLDIELSWMDDNTGDAPYGVDVLVDPLELELELVGGERQGAEHPHAAGPAHRRGHVTAVGEGEDRELDAERLAQFVHWFPRFARDP